MSHVGPVHLTQAPTSGPHTLRAVGLKKSYKGRPVVQGVSFDPEGRGQRAAAGSGGAEHP